jgi:toxin ParE1/3/4
MPAQQLVIASAAKSDLKDIYQYGLGKWGKAQSDSYLAALKDQFWSLTEQPLMGIERPELLPNTRTLHIQSHTLFTGLPPIGLKSSVCFTTAKT